MRLSIWFIKLTLVMNVMTSLNPKEILKCILTPIPLQLLKTDISAKIVTSNLNPWRQLKFMLGDAEQVALNVDCVEIISKNLRTWKLTYIHVKSMSVRVIIVGCGVII